MGKKPCMHTMYRNGNYHLKYLWALWEHWTIYFHVSWSFEAMRLDWEMHAGRTRVPHNFLENICQFGLQNPLFHVTIAVFCRLKTSVFQPTYFHGMVNSASSPDTTNSEQHWTVISKSHLDSHLRNSSSSLTCWMNLLCVLRKLIQS